MITVWVGAGWGAGGAEETTAAAIAGTTGIASGLRGGVGVLIACGSDSVTGAGIGAAMAGMKPISEIMFFDFIGVCMDQLTNHAAKLRYMSGGQTPIPMVVRVGMVGGQPIGAQHSQSLESWLMHSPGVKIAYPSTAYDAKGLMAACIEDPDPCVFVECTMLYANKDNVPQEYYTIPLGKAAVRREGKDVTIVTYGRYVAISLKAADELAKEGISAEVIDLRTLRPMDTQTVVQSVMKTGRCVVVDGQREVHRAGQPAGITPGGPRRSRHLGPLRTVVLR